MWFRYVLILGLLTIFSGCSAGEILSEKAEAAPASQIEFLKFEEAYPEGILADLEGLRESPEESLEEPLNLYELEIQTSLILEQEQRCHVGMSFFDGRTVETFEDEKRGLRFSFPYAPKWAHSEQSPRYEWLPSMKYDTLRFGPVGTPEGCNVPTYYFVSFIPAGTSDSVGSMGMCGPRPSVQLEGSKYTYEFYSLCGDEDEAQVLDRIIETASYT